MHNHNLVLLLPDGRRKPSGKIVAVGSTWHFHVTARPEWRLAKAAAWGLQGDIVAHCASCGVVEAHIFDKGECATYSVALRDLMDLSVPGYDRAWGRMRNLAEHYWQRSPGRVAASRVWVPDEVAEVIRHVSDLPDQPALPL